MELASMLAGEPFSDRPHSVCPVVASYLRALNDSLDDVGRQSLFPYASSAVGTAGGLTLQRRRAERCRDTLRAMQSSHGRVRRIVATALGLASGPGAARPLEDRKESVIERTGSAFTSAPRGCRR